MFSFFKRKKSETPRETVTRIFRDTLELDSVAPTDNFFELGGDSITATVVVTALGEEGYNLRSTAVFDHPTIDGVVKLVENSNSPPPAAQVPANMPKPRMPKADRVRASLLQERLWPFEQNPDPKRFQLRGEGAALLRGDLNVTVLRESLTLIIERHEVLRTSFAENGGEVVAQIHLAEPVELEELKAFGDTAADRRDHASRLVSSFTSRIFDLGTRPPYRCALVKISEDEHVLVVSMHHIICDGWSMGLFVNEVAVSYDAIAKQTIPALPTLPYQFADYASWHHDWLSSPSGSSAITFWRNYSEGLPDTLEVPLPAADGTRKSTINFPVRRQNIEMSDETQIAIRQFARAQQTSVHTVFLASVLIAFTNLTTQRDLPIGIMHANRNVIGTQNLIGFFSTLVLLRFKLLDSGSPIIDVIKMVQQATRTIEPHVGVPIGTLIEQGILDNLPRIFVDSVPRPAMPSMEQLTLEDFPFEHPPLFAVADIALFLFDNGSELTCMLGTNEEMFSDRAASTLSRAIQESFDAISR